MRRKLQKMAASVFEQEGPRIELSDERLELTFEEGTPLNGSFEINSRNQIAMRGIVYSDNPRMRLKEPEFSGTSVKLEYEFDTNGLVEGDIQKGEFFIICDKNEYTLSFVVSAVVPVDVIDTSILDSLKAFADFVKKDAKRAYEYFISPRFENCIRKESDEIKLMARLFSYEQAPYHNLEEFLCATGHKEEVRLETKFCGGVYEGVTQDIRETIEIIRHGWGNTVLEVTTDAPFIVMNKSFYDEEDFVGNSCRISFYISHGRLHAGKNYGTINIQSGKMNFVFQIEATPLKIYATIDEKKKDVKRSVWELTDDYVNYRIGKIMPATWASETLLKIDHLLAIDKDSIMLWLFKAQVLAMSNRNQEAQWILEQQKACKEQTNTRAYAYYMYVMTFLNKEKQFVRRVGTSIAQMYPYGEKDDVLFWILLLIDEAYENSKTRKYHAIKDYCMTHSVSPVFYAECWQLVKEQPGLLSDMGSFEIRLIRWIYRKQLISREFSIVLAELFMHRKIYQKCLAEILISCYRIYQQEEMLMALCSYLIRGNQYSENEYAFFKEALEKQMNITGLYEAYIISATKAKQTLFPKMVQYYLQYKSNLPYKYKAVVYRGIIKNREKQTTLYLNCKMEIEQFALEHIRAGHMDENLAYIYEFYLKQISITPELSKALAPLLYIHKLVCEDKEMKSVVVVHRQTQRTMLYPIVRGEAFFPLYSKDYVIGFEDVKGQRFFKNVEYDLIVLLSSESFTQKCLQATPDQMPYLIRYFDSRINAQCETLELNDKELNYLQTFLCSEAIRDDYKKLLRPALIRYYHQTKNDEWQDDYLTWLDVTGLAEHIRIQACELFIERGFYEKAYRTIVEHGCYSVSAASMLTLCSRMIEIREYEADDYLIGLCSMVFFRGKYNDILLGYLARYMYGSTRKLYDVWIACKDFNIATFELEERLLAQMLYSENFVNRCNEIITSYISNGGKKIILDAYVSYFAYQFFVKEAIANELAMEQILGEFKKGYSTSTLRKLALLKWLCEERCQESEVMSELYDEMILLGYRFKFFEELPSEVVFHFPRYGKRVIEFRGKENATFYIRYLHTNYTQGEIEEEYHTEQMEQMYNGIYIKEVTLFYGDTVQYYICEEKDGEFQVIYSGQLVNTEIVKYKGTSRYEQLNAVVIAEQLGEHQTAEDKMNIYDEWVEKAKRELVWIK